MYKELLLNKALNQQETRRYHGHSVCNCHDYRLRLSDLRNVLGFVRTVRTPTHAQIK